MPSRSFYRKRVERALAAKAESQMNSARDDREISRMEFDVFCVRQKDRIRKKLDRNRTAKTEPDGPLTTGSDGAIFLGGDELEVEHRK